VEYYEVYGRQEIEKVEYDAKVEKAPKERPGISARGGLTRFKRMETT